MNELRSELEKVKKRRQDREQEKAARDEEMTLLQREKEAAMFSVTNTSIHHGQGKLFLFIEVELVVVVF